MSLAGVPSSTPGKVQLKFSALRSKQPTVAGKHEPGWLGCGVWGVLGLGLG